MTQREFYATIASTETLPVELIEFASDAMAQMDAANEKRREASAVKRAAKAAEREPIREAVYAVITSEAKTASTLVEESGVEVTVQSIPSLLKPLIEAGDVIKTDVKVNGKTLRGYTRA